MKKVKVIEYVQRELTRSMLLAAERQDYKSADDMKRILKSVKTKLKKDENKRRDSEKAG